MYVHRQWLLEKRHSNKTTTDMRLMAFVSTVKSLNDLPFSSSMVGSPAEPKAEQNKEIKKAPSQKYSILVIEDTIAKTESNS